MNISTYKKVFFLLIVAGIFFSFSFHVYAETRYVTDRLIITMREGKGNEYKIIKTLKTGTPVQVIEEDDQYMRVRLQDGTEGWVLKRYISTDTPKPVIIAGLKKEIDSLKATMEQLKKDKKTIQNDLDTATQSNSATVKDLEKSLNDKDNEIAGLTRQLQETTGKYKTLADASKDVVSVVNERDMLRKENKDLTDERDRLKTENDNLIEKRMIYWFLAGAGVFFFGWLSGKVSRKKKRYY
jgi:SH3 domain protein